MLKYFFLRLSDNDIFILLETFGNYTNHDRKNPTNLHRLKLV